MWGRWVLLILYLLWTFASIKDAIDMNSNKFAWYTVFWFAVTMTGLIVTCIFYF